MSLAQVTMGFMNPGENGWESGTSCQHLKRMSLYLATSSLVYYDDYAHVCLQKTEYSGCVQFFYIW